MEALRLFLRGFNQSQVALRVGVHRQSVSRWVRVYKQSGRRGLRRARHVGRRPRLSAAQLRSLECALKRRPSRYGFAVGRWTAAKVRDLIERRTGVRYHSAHVSRLLRGLKERRRQARYQNSYAELGRMVAAARLARRARRLPHSQPQSGGPIS